MPPRGSRRFFYGWVMAPIAMAFAMGTMPGQSVGVAAFHDSICGELRLSASQFAGAYALGTVLASLLLPLAGAMMDRMGIRRAAMFILPAFAGACWLISSATGMVSLFISFLLLRFLGQGSLSLCSQNTLAMWFDRKLGRASGIVGTLVTLFMAASPLGLRAAIAHLGWRATYQGLGVAVLAGLVPLLLLFVNRPEDIGQQTDGKESPQVPDDSAIREPTSVIGGLTLRQSIRQPSYWILIALNVAWSMIGTSLIFTVQPMGRLLIGSSMYSCRWGDFPVEAANTLFFTSVAVMNLFGGFLADRYPVTRILRVALFGMVGGMLILLTGRPVSFFLAYMVYGAAQGLLSAVSSTIWPRFFGRAHLGSIRGGAMMAMVAGSSLGPIVMGFDLDHSGNYQISLGAFAVVMTGLGIASLFLRPPAEASA